MPIAGLISSSNKIQAFSLSIGEIACNKWIRRLGMCLNDTTLKVRMSAFVSM